MYYKKCVQELSCGKTLKKVKIKNIYKFEIKKVSPKAKKSNFDFYGYYIYIMWKNEKENLTAKGIEIEVYSNKGDYISLTDIAKYKNKDILDLLSIIG